MNSLLMLLLCNIFSKKTQPKQKGKIASYCLWLLQTELVYLQWRLASLTANTAHTYPAV